MINQLDADTKVARLEVTVRNGNEIDNELVKTMI